MNYFFAYFQGSSSMAILLIALVVAGAIVSYFCWDYHREWKIRQFYETKAWKERRKNEADSGD
jgi:hypothetical protein